MGWFYGFKLHLIINDEGGILAVKITAGNVDNRNQFQKYIKIYEEAFMEIKGLDLFTALGRLSLGRLCRSHLILPLFSV